MPILKAINVQPLPEIARVEVDDPTRKLQKDYFSFFSSSPFDDGLGQSSTMQQAANISAIGAIRYAWNGMAMDKQAHLLLNRNKNVFRDLSMHVLSGGGLRFFIFHLKENI